MDAVVKVEGSRASADVANCLECPRNEGIDEPCDRFVDGTAKEDVHVVLAHVDGLAAASAEACDIRR